MANDQTACQHQAINVQANMTSLLAAAGLVVAPESVVRDAATLLRLGSLGNYRTMQETADALDAALGDADEAPDSRVADWAVNPDPASRIKQWLESVAINGDMAMRQKGMSHETGDDADRAATVYFDRRDHAMRAIRQLADQLIAQRDAALAREKRLEALCRRAEAEIAARDRSDDDATESASMETRDAEG